MALLLGEGADAVDEGEGLDEVGESKAFVEVVLVNDLPSGKLALDLFQFFSLQGRDASAAGHAGEIGEFRHGLLLTMDLERGRRKRLQEGFRLSVLGCQFSVLVLGSMLSPHFFTGNRQPLIESR
jgi:hypothetical protein